MTSLNCSVLVHTFDGYKHLWAGCSNGWEYALPPFIPMYWGTDIETDFDGNFRVIYSGEGEWSDRLKRLLHQIPTDYVMYAQEDHWPKSWRDFPDLDKMMEIVTENDLFRLQLSPIVHFYKLTQAGNIHFFNPDSKYLVSHQPSIWKKSFLLSCLKSGETPWVNEYEGTKRLKNDPAIEKKIAIYPYDWFSHKCVKGVVQS